MEVKHTPGPWTIRHGTNVFGIRCDVGHEGSVATTGGHFSNQVDCGPESQANARLIAAAPDLLAALQFYVALCGNTAYSITRESAQEAFNKATAAIAKAKGQQSAPPDDSDIEES